MRIFFRFVALTSLILAFSGCSVQVSENAKGAVKAYNDLIDNLKSCSSDAEHCDKEKIWNAMDAQSRSLYLEAYAALIRIDRIIETYFDPIEHKHMRARTGTDILKSASINEYKDLFFYVFQPDKLVFDENTISGAEFEKDIVQNSNVITIQTHQADQQFVMIKEDDGVWRTNGLLNVSAVALDPIFVSENAMKEYAKGNLESELKRRDAVRKYFTIQQEAQRRLSNM